MTTEQAPTVWALVSLLALRLQEGGVSVSWDRKTRCVETLLRGPSLDAEHIYWTGRIALCSEPADLAVYDTIVTPSETDTLDTAESALGPDQTVPNHSMGWTAAAEVGTLAAALLHPATKTDIRDLAAVERAEIHELIAEMRPGAVTRHSRHRTTAGRANLDRKATIRAWLRSGGEPGRMIRRGNRDKPRRLVFIQDVSGSMRAFAEANLRFAYAAVQAAPRRAEVFTIGTGLTRVTRALKSRHVDTAIKSAVALVPDWNGGTRLGGSLRAFLDIWGQRGLARGAIVVICSDGRERDSINSTTLEEQMRRLKRLAFKIIWAHPYSHHSTFEPIGGMRAVLESVDHLESCHSLAAFRSISQRLIER